MLKNIARALRLPFITGSVLPFIFGSLIPAAHLNFPAFLFGIIAAASMHLSANLINDYADSKSGADWQDRSFYGFFGGSKLIQEGILSERFYFNLAVLFACISACSVIMIAFIMKSLAAFGFYLLILILSWGYSRKPVQFVYKKTGEIFIFILFGPALVMGGYFIQTGIFPDLRSLILSLPAGFFITAVLFANEVPDFTSDKAVGKMTWVSITGAENAFALYTLIQLMGFLSIALGIILGYLNPIAAVSFFFVPLAIKAANILRRDFKDKDKLVASSKLTIAVHALANIALIAAAITGKFMLR